MPKLPAGFLSARFATVVFSIVWGAEIWALREGRLPILPVVGQGLLVVLGIVDCIRTAQGRDYLLAALLISLTGFLRKRVNAKP